MVEVEGAERCRPKPCSPSSWPARSADGLGLLTQLEHDARRRSLDHAAGFRQPPHLSIDWVSSQERSRCQLSLLRGRGREQRSRCVSDSVRRTRVLALTRALSRPNPTSGSGDALPTRRPTFSCETLAWTHDSDWCVISSDSIHIDTHHHAYSLPPQAASGRVGFVQLYVETARNGCFRRV